ncbi:MAG: guanylate kinase [Agathobacter sp.]|nr:guanylate kinase [Agathobacter sp.]
MSEKGILVVVSGFSGAGKGTIMKRLMETRGENYALSVSATTRKPRPGEVHGREYFFVDTDEFERMIEQDELVEYARYVDNYYGTPKKYVEDQLSAGKNVILEIEIQGALKIKKKFPETVLMFVATPSANILKERLVGRGTETQDVIDSRLSRAYEESLGIEEYDYLVINDDLEQCVELVDNIISAERFGKVASEESKISSKIDFINEMRNELLCFSKGDL